MWIIKKFLHISTFTKVLKNWIFRDIVTNILSKVTHNVTLELIWTILPALILILIAIPSLKLLYFMENPFAASSLNNGHVEFYYKVIGHQWYWSYEYAFNKIHIDLPVLDTLFPKTLQNLNSSERTLESVNEVFDSYMLSEDDVLETDGFRLLEVDNPLLVKSHAKIKFLITSSDVLHAWSVPALGIKIDAVPGRLSLVLSSIKYSGIFYGQCSEICGVNHGFMPIKASNIRERGSDAVSIRHSEFKSARGGEPCAR